ncbi:MAG: DUF5329 domain-containing protein [Desulfovibrio sp.]|nr:DUF5329 domain-containing protein [Desulfovibrio sp.]
MSCRYQGIFILLAAVFFCWFCLFPVFCPGLAFAMSAGETERVERMLEALSRESGIVFIRNDAEHTAEAAAAHLKKKFEYAANNLSTAEEFIDKVGSRSSLSNREYLVRKTGEKARPARDYLFELLRRLDSNAASP